MFGFKKQQATQQVGQEVATSVDVLHDNMQESMWFTVRDYNFALRLAASNSTLPISIWFMAAYLIEHDGDIPINQLAKELGTTWPTANKMSIAIRAIPDQLLARLEKAKDPQ